MLALLTSCGRFDLLEITLKSFSKNIRRPIKMVVMEDSMKSTEINREFVDLLGNNHVHTLCCTGRVGQHKAIEAFITQFPDEKYFIHIEDDWEFNNSYDWIKESIKIMERNPNVIKVLCRDGSPHPCVHNVRIEGEVPFGYIRPWENNGVIWSGFSWNPGVTRLDLLKQFVPFGAHEQDVAEAIYNAGYKVVELSIPIYKHIGDGRSTHE